MTAAEQLRHMKKALAEAGLEPAQLEAEMLLAAALGCSRSMLFARLAELITKHELEKAQQLLRLRLEHHPVQYLVGYTYFYGLRFEVNKDTFIPRPETEHLVELAEVLARQNDARLIADIGTGCGNIAVALARNLPTVSVVATDISLAALRLAHRNAEYHKAADRITFLRGDLFQPLREAGLNDLDLVVSNPPYVATEDYQMLVPEVRCHEPRVALDGGGDGMGIIKRLIADAWSFIRPGGSLVIEIGYGQKKVVGEIFASSSRYDNIRFCKDFRSVTRIVWARVPPSAGSGQRNV